MNSRTAFLVGCLGAVLLFSAPLNAQTQNQADQPSSISKGDASAQPAASELSDYESATSFFAPINDRIMSDVMYLSLQGQIYGDTGYEFGDQSYSRYNSTGGKSRFNEYNNRVSQTLGYSISDRFFVKLSDTYAFGKNDDSSGGSVDARGFEDPTLAATYRAVDQRNQNPFNLDLNLSYTPDIISDKVGGHGQTGTEGAGYNEVGFSAALGHEMKGLTVATYAGATYQGHGKFENLSSGENGIRGDGWNYFWGIESQTRVTERFSINTTIEEDSQHTVNSSNQTTGLSWASHYMSYTELTTSLNYHIILNRLVAQVYYQSNIFHNTKVLYSDSADNTEDKADATNEGGVRLMYIFNSD